MRRLCCNLLVVTSLIMSNLAIAAPPSMLISVIFNDPIENNNFASRGWTDNTTQTLANDGAVAGSTKSINWTWQQGQTTPPSGASMRYNLSETDNVYISFYAKVSSNWVGSGVSYHPHLFWFLTNKNGEYAGPYGSELTLYVEQLGLNPRLAFANPANVDGVFYDSVPTLTPNTWHRIEAFFKLNSIVGGVGQNDGIVKYWLDGTLVIDNNNVMMRTGNQNSNMMIDQLGLAPYIKPVGAPGSPVAQTMWVDDVTIGLEDPTGNFPNAPTNLNVD